VQFNMESVGLPVMPDVISDDVATQIREEAERRGIAIGAVQGTFNMSHPDPEFRQSGLQRLRKLAEACRTLGTRKIAICIGTRDRDDMWRKHPDNDSPAAWRDMYECVSEAVKIAEDLGLTLALEPEVNNIVDSARTTRRLLDEIGSSALKVTMDPANLFHAGELPRMAEVMNEAFALLGSDIVLAHAKDLTRDGDAGHEVAGQGLLDYGRYLSLLRGCGFAGPLLLHGLHESQVAGCTAFLRQKLGQ
jgi:sugar phosphate isomerase/epimerase